MIVAIRRILAYTSLSLLIEVIMRPKSDKPIIVPERDAGKRLDAFLSAYLKRETDGSAPSRVRIREAIEHGDAIVNGTAQTNPKKRLTRGDAISFTVPETAVELLPNPDLPLTVLFEDDDLLVIDKPAGVATHPVSFEETDTVANWALAHAPGIRDIGENPIRPGIVHRLDRNTSGILAIAKTAETFDELKRLFADRLAEKRYWALVIGHLPHDTGEIAYPIAPVTGSLRRQAIFPGKDVPENAREALSRFRVKKRFAKHDLLEVCPKTGRTHQIRVHLAATGCPVFGDRLYGGRRMNRPDVPARQLLHAGHLSFPWSGSMKIFDSPLPEDFRETLFALDETWESGYLGEDSNGTIRP